MTFARRVGDWAEAARIFATMQARLPAALKQALLAEGQFLRSKMIRGLISGAPGGKKFKPHSDLTLAIRKAQGFGGTKVLIQTGSLLGSIAVVPFGGGVFVGVRRGAARRGRKDIVDIAEIHEEGRSWTQRMTARQRRFLFAMLRKAGNPAMSSNAQSGGATLSIRIPARPFIKPIIKKYAKPRQLRRRLLQRVAVAMGGDFGP